MHARYEEFVKTYPKAYHSAEFYPMILRLHKTGQSALDLSKQFKVPRSTVRAWVKHERVPIPFQDYSTIKHEFDEEDIKNLATIVGHIYGDGAISARSGVMYCNTEQFLIDEFISAVHSVFKVRPVVRDDKNIYRVYCYLKIARILWCLFGKFACGRCSKIITKQIRDMSLSWKTKMLSAWFNDDGSVPEHKHYRVVSLKQKLKPLLEFIKETLDEVGVRSQISKDDKWWLLRITNYRSLVKFRDTVNFSRDYRKRKKLDEIISKIKIPQFVTKQKILDLLKEDPKTRKELAESFDIDPRTVYGHLHGYKRKDVMRKSNPGLIDMNLVRVDRSSGKAMYSLNACKQTLSAAGSEAAGNC